MRACREADESAEQAGRQNVSAGHQGMYSHFSYSVDKVSVLMLWGFCPNGGVVNGTKTCFLCGLIKALGDTF